ncbi:hypothetical protein Pcinc_041368 [Petrolisthes cinctipes]|uniref:Uncharacterized protein n=1 Tax=Petrolisthes cinctipes TaxID=88211 RepID=A0AAE1BM71_PETCI|nr:hypothetical protein Pcinc_041368 [Petrolisthes cinctipes]
MQGLDREELGKLRGTVHTHTAEGSRVVATRRPCSANEGALYTVASRDVALLSATPFTCTPYPTIPTPPPLTCTPYPTPPSLPTPPSSHALPTQLFLLFPPSLTNSSLVTCTPYSSLPPWHSLSNHPYSSLPPYSSFSSLALPTQPSLLLFPPSLPPSLALPTYPSLLLLPHWHS